MSKEQNVMKATNYFLETFKQKAVELNVTKFKNENVTGYLKSRTGTKKESPSKKTFN